MILPYRERSTFQLLWEDRIVAKHFRSGVSLHSHTMHSEERLDLLPRHIGKLPILSRALPDHIDYRQGFWTPPLSPRQAYRLEEKQIHRHLQLPALISLTDHDDIRAGTMLRVMERYQSVPISVEWTVPFGCTFFHIGVHTLPAADAYEILQHLKSFTDRPDKQSLREKLSFLDTHREVLLVLNHPLWDEKGIGSEAHAQELGRLLSLIHPYLHALELNGLRSWSENSSVIRLGADCLRCDFLPECHMACTTIRDRRRTLRYRHLLVRQMVQMNNRVSGLLLETGVSYNKARLHQVKYFQELLTDKEVTESIRPLLRLSHETVRRLDKTETALIRSLERDPVLAERIKNLKTIPGIGVITALTWALEMDDVSRFRSVKQAISYCGFCGDERSSQTKFFEHPSRSNETSTFSAYW